MFFSAIYLVFAFQKIYENTAEEPKQQTNIPTTDTEATGTTDTEVTGTTDTEVTGTTDTEAKDTPSTESKETEAVANTDTETLQSDVSPQGVKRSCEEDIQTEETSNKAHKTDENT